MYQDSEVVVDFRRWDEHRLLPRVPVQGSNTVWPSYGFHGHTSQNNVSSATTGLILHQQQRFKS